MNPRHLAAIAPRALRLLVVAFSLVLSPLGWQTAAAHPPLPPEPHGPRGPYAPQAVTHPVPTHGDQKMLVILTDFSDRVGLFTGQDWQTALYGPAGFSDYYKEVSYNQLRYTGTVVGLSGGTPVTNSASVAYVRLPNPITFYADGANGFHTQSGKGDKNHTGVVHDAVDALNSAGFDFAPYANPLTNKVDNVLVIFAGSDSAYTQEPNNSLGATAYRLFWSDRGLYTTTGGQIIDDYTFCPDQQGNLSGNIALPGPCAHEQGHALGDFDLYDFSYTTAGVGNYDNMGAGAYGLGASQGLRPVHFSVFSKELFGWITPTVMAPGTFTVTLDPAETSPSFVKLVPFNDPNSSEFFLLENRQPIGFDQDWYSGGLCGGLLIWHIDQNIVDNFPYAVETVNLAGSPPHQGVVLVEADGNFDLIHTPLNNGECSDTWTTGQTWNGASTPNSHLWNGTNSGLALTVVSEVAGSVTLRISTGPYAIRLPLIQN